MQRTKWVVARSTGPRIHPSRRARRNAGCGDSSRSVMPGVCFLRLVRFKIFFAMISHLISALVQGIVVKRHDGADCSCWNCACRLREGAPPTSGG